MQPPEDELVEPDKLLDEDSLDELLDDEDDVEDDFDEDDLDWFEQQAYEFGGRLLVPRDHLLAEIGRLAPKILEYKKFGGHDEEQIVQAISRLICKRFAVSADVIARRIKSEKIDL
jgi:Zn-dependent peptidase ImmA (M78 family)